MKCGGMTKSWKLTLPCTRAEAEALSDDMGALAELDPPPALMTSEMELDDPEKWQVDAYFEGKPAKKTIALLQSMVPSSAGVAPALEALPDEDWVTLSQQGLEPIVAGRFHVRNHADDPVPSNLVPLLIPAGRAFGTGQHETTAGCLMMLDRCRGLGENYRNIVDVGTGTGLLAFAALDLWRRAHVTASDVDPAAVEVTAENAVLNHVAIGHRGGELSLYAAAGVNHPALHGRAPYDLVIANILAGPLIELAPSLCAVLEEGGTLILAGLLDTQADRVAAAYRAQGLRLVDRIEASTKHGEGGQWPCLRFRKRPAIGWKRPRRWSAEANGDAPGFGSW
ncbi:MAG: 50S ribosomal protein L11 methyltransferase [Sphingobium sp.]|nr:50S ribosomal protein L11 methyltransferase [Sphingobium sp.]